jgi:hypothetical protein
MKWMFGVSAYPPIVQQLLTPERLMELGPGTPQLDRRGDLARLDTELIFARHRLTDRTMARCCLAALWLYHDFLTESHTISQEIGTKEGSYWHGIMHRREPDAWNSKYWFRRVNEHPVIHQLGEQSRVFGYDYRSPFDFVDDCERHRGTNSPTEVVLRQVQLCEWQLLFDYCWRHAVGAMK